MEMDMKSSFMSYNSKGIANAVVKKLKCDMHARDV